MTPLSDRELEHRLTKLEAIQAYTMRIVAGVAVTAIGALVGHFIE